MAYLQINLAADLEVMAATNPRTHQKLKSWFEEIKNYEQLSFKKARLLSKIISKSHGAAKNIYRQKLILGTLYLVFHFVCTSGLTAISSPNFDVDDLICICTEIWINMLDKECLLSCNNFTSLFVRSFYTKVTRQLVGESNKYYDYKIGPSKLNCDIFGKILKQYLDYVKSGKVYDEKSCYACVVSLLEEARLLTKLKDGEVYQLYMVFYSFLKVLNTDELMKKSITDLGSLKIILFEVFISNDNAGLIEKGDFTEAIDNRYFIERIMQSLTEQEKKVIEMLYGFSTGDPMTQQEVAELTGLTRARIGQILNEAQVKMKKLINQRENIK